MFDEEAAPRDRALTELFAPLEKHQRLLDALAPILHDLFRTRLEDLVKGMPLKDGGLRLSAEAAARVTILSRTGFEFLEPEDQARARADAARLLKLLAEAK